MYAIRSYYELTVAGVKAHAGIALDGDGDRLVMVDHLGRTVDGGGSDSRTGVVGMSAPRPRPRALRVVMG